MIHEEARILIRTENMSKYYNLGNRKTEAVISLDAKIMQGEFVVIKGIWGNQKNALFNLLGCLERPDSGKYFFDYEDIALAKDEMLEYIRRERIGYLFRDFRLIDRLTVCQNIEVPMYGMNISPREKKSRRDEALRVMQIQELAEDKVSSLSDFNKQLVSLARAIANEPLMIIADEAAANLDIDEARNIMEQLYRINESGVTVLLFTSESAVKMPGRYRLISFENGRLAADRDHEGPAF